MIDTDRRKFIRFLITLNVKAKKEKEESFGLVKDFSRKGLRAVFDDFNFDINSYVELELQRLSRDMFIPATAEVIWKRPIKGKWEVGFRLKEFLPQAKAEILDLCYRGWLRGASRWPSG